MVQVGRSFRTKKLNSLNEISRMRKTVNLFSFLKLRKPGEIFVRDNKDVFDDGTAQLMTYEEIRDARSTLSSKVRLFSVRELVLM